MADETTLTGFANNPDISGVLNEWEEQETPEPQYNPNNGSMAAPMEPQVVEANIAQALDEYEGAGVRAPDRPGDKLMYAQGIVSPEESQSRSRALSLSKELNVPADVVEVDLMEMTPEQIRARSRTNDIAKYYPALATWGSDPHNSSIIERNVGWTQGVNKTFEALNPEKRSDVEKVLSNALIDYRQAVIDLGMVTGAVTVEEGKKLLREADAERAKNANMEAEAGMRRFGRELEDISAPFADFLRGVKSVYEAATDDKVETEIIPAVKQAAGAGADTMGELWDAMVTLYEDPQAAKVFGLQALLSSSPAIGAGLVGGAIGKKLAGAPGAVVGSGISAASVSFPLEFSAKLREEMEAFRDPVTGEMDYDAAFSDPARVERWRKEAAVFSSVIAASDAFYSLVIGKPFLKIVSKIPSKPAAAAAGVAAEAATGAFEEGASNLTATIASKAATGREVSPESIAESGADIAADVIGGGMVGGTVGPVMSGARHMMDSGHEKYQKIKSEIRKSNIANEMAATLSNARAKLKEDKMSQEHRAQVEALVEGSVKPESAPVDPDIYDDADTVTSEEISANESEVTSGQVEFTPSKLAEFFAREGMTVEEALTDLPQVVFDEFVRNRASDTAVSIPVTDWIRVTEEFPEFDSIVRINGNEMNAEEASATQEEMASEPFSLFQQREDGPPPVPGQEDVAPPPLPEIPVVGDPLNPMDEQQEDGDDVTFLNEISSKFRVEEEEQAYQDIKKLMRRVARRSKNLPTKAADLATEIQFRRVMNRSRITGIPAREIIAQLNPGAVDRPGVEGSLTFQRGFDGGVLALSTTANPSTLMHELGHLWMNEMAVDYHQLKKMNFAEMSDAQRAYWESMDLASSFFGLDNIGQLNEIDDARFTEIQERFAQTTEKYFLDGEFGDSTIRALMERFRKFLVGIADIVGVAYKQYPALEITAEVERMFEGILAPKVKADEIFLPLFPEPAFDVSVLGSEAPKYYSQIRDSLAVAVSKFMSKVHTRSYRERERLISQQMNEAYDEAVDQIDQRPEMILKAQIEDSYSEYKRLKKEGRKVPDPRMSWNSFLDLFNGNEDAAAEARNQLRNVVAPKKKGGVDVGLIMLGNGVHDPVKMRNDLLLMAQRDDMIEAQADEILRQRLPVLKSDEEMAAAAEEALVESSLNTLFRQELKIMAENHMAGLMGTAEIMGRSPESWMNDEATSEEAARIVTESTANKFSSRKFRNDYRQTARDAARFFRQGNMTKAFEMKVKSIIAYKAYTQSVDAVHKLISVKKRIKQFNKYSRNIDYARVYDADIMSFGQAFIKAIANGQRILPKLFTPDPFDPQIVIPDVSGASISDVVRINNMIDYFATQSEGKYGPDAISVGNTILMGEIIKMIQSAARRARSVEVAGNKMFIEDLRSNASLEIDGSQSAVRNYESNDWISSYRVSKDQLQTVLGSLYRNDEEYVSSSIGRLMSQVDQGQARRNRLYTEMRERIVSAVDKAIQTTRDKGAVETVLLPLLRRVPWIGSRTNVRSKESRPIYSPELEYTFNNLSEYWMAELLMGSETGAEKFLKGYGLAEFDFETGRIDRSKFVALRNRLIREGVLTKEHFDMMQEIWDSFAEQYPDIRTTLRETDGYNVGKVEGIPFDTPFGRYKGGYVPVAAIEEMAGRGELEALVDGDASRMRVDDLYPAQRTGMANERKRKYYPVDLNMNRILLYLGAATDIIHMRKPLLDLGRVLKGPEVVKALEVKRPGAMKNVIVPWFRRVKNQERTEKTVDVANRFARHLRRSINRSIYLGRASTAFIQYTGLVNGLLKIGPNHLARGMFEFNSSPQQSKAFIEGSSDVMKHRFHDGVRRHIDDWDEIMTNFDWINRSDEIIDKYTFILIQSAQNHVDRMIWMGAYNKQRAANKNHKEAVEYADFIINSTQASSDVSWLNKWQSGKAIEKLVTGIATSFVFSINNVVTREAARDPNKTRQIGLVLGFGAMYYGLNQAMDATLRQVLEEAWDGISGEGGEEDDEEKLMMIASRAASGMLGLALPIAGALPEAFAYTGRVDFAPAMSMIAKEGTYAVSGAQRAAEGIPLTTREIQGLLKTITLFTGIPTSILAKDMFVEDVYMEGLSGESVERRLEDRRYMMQNKREDRRY